MNKKDAKMVFDFTGDTKMDIEKEELLLKTIEVMSK